MTWSISPNTKNNPRHRGAEKLGKGIELQQGYAVSQLTRLLDPQDRLRAVRYVGIQDVDLLFRDDAIFETVEWLTYHPDDNYVRAAYLGFVERNGNPDQLNDVLLETAEWLREHRNDKNVRGTYDGLVKRRGSPR